MQGSQYIKLSTEKPMPIYEYQCQSCDDIVEVIQKISDDPLIDCSACGKPDLKKKISAAAFRLSGTGWYETDFKPKNKKNPAANVKNKPKETKKESKPSTPSK